MGGAVSKRMLEFMDHQAIAIDTPPFQGDWASCDVTAQALEFISLMGFTGHRRIQGKTVTCRRR